MERIACISSQIKSHGYDPTTKTLEIEFTNGAVYQYADVPPDVAAGFGDCDSVGRHFGQAVRGKHPHTMVTPPQ